MTKPKTNATPKRGRGRPRAIDKRVSMRVPVSASERTRLEAASTLRGLPLAQWCRMVLLYAAGPKTTAPRRYLGGEHVGPTTMKGQDTMGMPRQMIVEHARGIAETSGPDEANVAMVEMEGVRLVRGRIPSQVKRALNAAVKSGRLGHLRRDGLAPEAYFHRNARSRALEMREAEAKRGVAAVAAVLVPHRPIALDDSAMGDTGE